MYSINEQVSDSAGTNFKVFRSERNLKNSDALDLILINLPKFAKLINSNETIKED